MLSSGMMDDGKRAIGPHYKDMEAQHVVDVLDRKRRQLDEEIARFKAEKDEEYRAFERLFKEIFDRGDNKSETKDVYAGGEGCRKEEGSWMGFISGPSSLGSNRRYNMRRENSRQSELSRSLQDASISALGIIKEGLAKEEGLENGGFPDNGRSNGPYTQGHPRALSLSVSVSEPLLVSDDEHNKEHAKTGIPTAPTFKHERELEFRGLFTPSFLPLLESSAQSPGSISAKRDDAWPMHKENESQVHDSPNDLKHPATPQPVISTTSHSDTLTSSSRTSSKPLRLSLPGTTTSLPSSTTTTSLPSSTTTTSSLSSATTTTSATKERTTRLSSSSPACTSSSATTVLHSSLRSPTSKKPRSPKHVHFRIDDAVVPPSSTPPRKPSTPVTVHIMPWPAEPATPPDMTESAVTTSSEATTPEQEKVWLRKQLEKKNQPANAAEAGEEPEVYRKPAPTPRQLEDALAAAAATAATAVAAASAAEGPRSPEAGVGSGSEEAESVFLLDEELAGDGEGEGDDDDDEAAKGGEYDDDAASIYTSASGSSMNQGSPHASSLPIDIVYPAPVDPRKE